MLAKDTPGSYLVWEYLIIHFLLFSYCILILLQNGWNFRYAETVWRTAQKHEIPAIAFVNKLDREGADFAHVLGTLERRLGVHPLPLQVRND